MILIHPLATSGMFKAAKIIGRVGDVANYITGTPTKDSSLPEINDEVLLYPTYILAAKIRERELTCESVVRAYIERAKIVQTYLNAIVDDRYDEAIADAKKVDQLLKLTKLTNREIEKQFPLLGIPFTVKDSIKVDKMIWTSGCYRRKNIVATGDAPVVNNFRKAGAIPIALTNVPELLLWFASSNKLHGATNNPFDLNRVPGGSSGGEAALIAASGSPLSICSDIGGSIRMPAFHCGLFGHKPTHNVIDHTGTFPEIKDGLEDLFSFGPISRYADDLLPSLLVMAGPNYKKFKDIDKPVDLRKIKVYYLEETGNEISTDVEPYIKEAILKAANHFGSKYNTLVQRAEFKYFKDVALWYMILFSNNHQVSELLTENTSRINPFIELAKYTIGKSDYSPSALAVAAAQMTTNLAFDKTTSPEVFEKTKETLAKARQEFYDLLGDEGVFIYVSLPRTAPSHYASAFEFGNVCCPMVMNYLNVPSTQVPTGKHNGLPYGIQIASAPYNDRLTLAVAKELEGLFGGWINPSKVNLKKQ